MLSGLLVLGALNWAVWEREQLVQTGEPMLLELAPVDPRALMQGDYMALNYAIGAEVTKAVHEGRRGSGAEIGRAPPMSSGLFVLRLDAQGVGRFHRLYDGGPLGPTERLLSYQDQPGLDRVVVAPEAFFFQEGLASTYATARYGILHIDGHGDRVLVGLADEARQPLAARSNRPASGSLRSFF